MRLPTPSSAVATSRPGEVRCRRKFLRSFPRGFADSTYNAWERDYKWQAHLRWVQQLGRARFAELLAAARYREIADSAVRIESRTNLLFSFEKMALRDAVRDAPGARRFSQALYILLHGKGSARARFEQWCEALDTLPRRQTRVLTWPTATVFGFLAQPERHFFLKPNVTRAALAAYDLPFHYVSRPNWETYREVLEIAATVRSDLRDLEPRDLIDVQSFLWVQGSAEYD